MLNRRDAMIRLGRLGLGALTLPGLLHLEDAQARTAPAGPRGKAKSCINIFLWGGPPQMDLWDLKPNAPEGIRTLFSPIATNVPGIQIGDQMPLLSKHMDKVAIVRSLSHKSDIHGNSIYHMLTGKRHPTTADAIPRRRGDFPYYGSVIGHLAPTRGIPATVTVPRPIGVYGLTHAGTYAGLLGPGADPMETREAPGTQEKATHAFLPPEDVDAMRLQGRFGLRRVLDEQDRLLNSQRATKPLDTFYDQAFSMTAAPLTKQAFSLDRETPAVRDHYGRNDYGDSILLARRLVEAGVRLVTIIWMYIKPDGGVSNVWDNHAGYGFFGCKTGYDLLKSPLCIPPLDRAYSALLADLADRGLLEETLVVAAGEFGRTPKINKDLGRDHWGACQSALLAGGGIRGGQVYGASDSHAAFVKENPVAPEDLIATVYHAFGIGPEREIHDREGRPHAICDGKPVVKLFT